MTTYKRAAIQGHRIFYREAGSTANPTIVLLHGFPSSHMFRELIQELASHFHGVVPDYLGFGYSDAPAATDFPCTFDNVTAQMPAGLSLIPNGDASASQRTPAP